MQKIYKRPNCQNHIVDEKGTQEVPPSLKTYWLLMANVD